MSVKPRMVIELPDEERGRSLEDVRRFERLQAKLARRDLKPKQRDETERELANLESAAQERQDKLWRERMVEEIKSLAVGRGEPAEVLKSGAVRLDDHDPLLRLLRLGHLTVEQADIGKECADLYERRFEGVNSQLGEPGGGGHNNDRFVLGKLQRAKALQRIAMVEVAIVHGVIKAREGRIIPVKAWEGFKAPHMAAPAHARDVFREVCGDGKSLAAISKGSAFAKNLAGLKVALDVAHEVIRG